MAGRFAIAPLVLLLGTSVASAQNTTITMTKKVTKVTHQQCVMMRMAHAKSEASKMKAEEWCRKRGDTVPRGW